MHLLHPLHMRGEPTEIDMARPERDSTEHAQEPKNADQMPG